MDERVECLDAEHDIVCIEHVVGVELVGCNGMHAFQVLHALPSGYILATHDEQQLLAIRNLAEERDCALGRRRLPCNQFGDDVDALVACAVREGSAKSGCFIFLGVRWL